MSLFKRYYKILVPCPNCGFADSMVKVPLGVSVEDFVKTGQCICDSCGVIFFPEEYTTEHFEKKKLAMKHKDKDIKKIKEHIDVPKPGEFKW